MAEKPARLKAIRSHASPEEITEGMRKTFTSPDRGIQSRKSISVSNAIGEAELHFYRGHSSGVFDSYLTLKQKYPNTAKELLKAFGMRDNNGEWEF